MTTPLIPQNFTAEKNGDSPDLLTVDECAKLLRVNRKTLYQAISNGEIDGVIRIGRTIRILKSAVLHSMHGQGHPYKASRRRR